MIKTVKDFFQLCSILFFMIIFPAHSAGFREIISNNVHFGIWYPTANLAIKQRLGPFETIVAKDAPPQKGSFPLVMLEPGNGGRYRNHHLTAISIANAGFIVIAVEHQADYLIGGSKTPSALDRRYLDMLEAIRFVRSDPALGTHLAESPVNGVGYSLGGVSILLAAGATFDMSISSEYCDSNSKIDPEFCDDPSGVIFRLGNFFKTNLGLRSISNRFRHDPLLTGRIVLIAPVTKGIDTAGIKANSISFIGIIGDQIAKPQFHLKPLSDILAKEFPVNVEMLPGHHYAFVAPFLKSVTDKEHIPIAIDPEGFDRTNFINNANTIIIKALTEGVKKYPASVNPF